MSTGHATSQPGPGWALVKPPRLEQLPASAGRGVTNLQGAVARGRHLGGAGGGQGLAERFAAAGARAVVVADLDGPGAGRVAAAPACPAPLGGGLGVADHAGARLRRPGGGAGGE